MAEISYLGVWTILYRSLIPFTITKWLAETLIPSQNWVGIEIRVRQTPYVGFYGGRIRSG